MKAFVIGEEGAAIKRILCILLFVLFAISQAMAEPIPGKTLADLVQVTVQAENVPGDAGIVIEINSEKLMPRLQDAMRELLASRTVAEYFAHVQDADGNILELSELLASGGLHINELIALDGTGYSAEYGDVCLTLQLMTPFAKGEQVTVLFAAADAEPMIWLATEGTGNGQDGAMTVKLTPQIMSIIQQGALLAVASR